MDIPRLMDLVSLRVIDKEGLLSLCNSKMDARDGLIIEFSMEVMVDMEGGFTAKGAYH